MNRFSSVRPLLFCGALAPPVFVVVFLVAGALRAGYDPTYHPVSALSLGGLGWLQITSFVVTGLLLLAFAVGLRRVMRPGPGSRWAPVLIGMVGVSLVASGVFVMDPIPTFPPGTTSIPEPATWHHTLHDLAGAGVFGLLPIACFVMARWFGSRPGRPGWMWYSLVTGVAMIVLLIAFGTAYEADHAASGLVQRAQIIVGWAWISLVALRLWADQRPVSPQRSGS
ncbi:DUF998 domain-containing protein [Natronosporangium hydrolyticum]|uniref:DUF998 domain-containing protein n=1 Tax=Natronosporangium hydrolyticum TaxID=2811111 RepID=A0A895YLN6_9ACTN|nr:DUF998 domain-containing protein [Natronosporangium hydrolyticum]QSB16892.1 DUF998 domain-containing protein [Natronosporangium hydrolyticum]